MRTILGVLLIFLLGCQPTANRQSEPTWITNPEDGAVGSAVTHVRGRYHQEELAIARARERLAARYGVEISSVQTIREKVVNERAYVTSDKETWQSVTGKTVKARVRETWYDAARDVIWVWLYPVE